MLVWLWMAQVSLRNFREWDLQLGLVADWTMDGLAAVSCELEDFHES